MTVSEFVAKWQKVALTERAAAQQRFLDLCDQFEHPKPADADPTGEWFTFGKGVAKHGGGDGEEETEWDADERGLTRIRNTDGRESFSQRIQGGNELRENG